MKAKDLWLAAKHGDWSKIEISQVTKKMLDSRSDWGNSIFHYAAGQNLLHKIPKEFLTHDIWLKTNKRSETVLHYTAQEKEFHLVPNKVLTENNLLLEDIYQWTVLDYVCENQSLTYIPKKALTDKSLGNVDRQWGSSLNILISKLVDQTPNTKESNNFEILFNNIKIVLSVLSNKSLKKHLHKKSTPESPNCENMKSLINKELFKRELTQIVQSSQNLEI
jgi:hypothetical protein